MLFNSYEFIFLYLPIVGAGFFLLGRSRPRAAALWLAAASLFFYGWWNSRFVSLLLASIVFNYKASQYLGGEANSSKRRLTAFVAIDLALLGFFKYTNFFIDAANSLGAHVGGLDIVLPLGISFFTFTQIAFLVDVHRGVAREYNFPHYLLFVTWFPHLIAGPILHHKQMMPQFALPQTYRPSAESIAVGLTMFSLGLFKKVVLADHLAQFANPVFNAAAQGAHPMLLESWIGTLAYTLQLYFDFSGYSDMAIGLSRMFNVKLPLNFNSPYKAADIIDFWRRWHMTLSTFLRDYLYIPLGGNRGGPARRHVNLMTTMLLGGLWHGAGWNFVIWGGLHGLFLVVNHLWRAATGAVNEAKSGLSHALGVLATFLVVMLAWVPFRATSLGAVGAIWSGLVGLNGARLGFSGPFDPRDAVIWIAVGLGVVWAAPNSQEWLADFTPAWDRVVSASPLKWAPSRGAGVVAGVVCAVAILSFQRNSPFLYFQF